MDAGWGSNNTWGGPPQQANGWHNSGAEVFPIAQGGWGSSPPPPEKYHSNFPPVVNFNQNRKSDWGNHNRPQHFSSNRGGMDVNGLNPRNVAQARDQQFIERRRGYPRGPRGNRGDLPYRGKRPNNWSRDPIWQGHQNRNDTNAAQSQHDPGWGQTEQVQQTQIGQHYSPDSNPNCPNNEANGIKQDDETPLKPNGQNVRHHQKQDYSPKPKSNRQNNRGNFDKRRNHPPERKKNAGFATTAETRPDPASDIFEDEDAQVASDHADNGFLDTKVLAQGHKQGEGEYSLLNWDGGWAPAPVDWEDRPSYHEKHYRERVLEWEPLANMEKYEFCLNDEKFENLEGEICPRCWVPEKIDEFSPDMWWKKRTEAREFVTDPEYSDCYIEPFWRRFSGPQIEVLEKLEVPEPKVDPKDNEVPLLNQTVAISIASYLQKSHRRRSNNQKHKAMQRERAMLELEMGNQNEFSPKLNCYLRPVDQTDMPQIHRIWNYWIDKSITTPELEQLPLASVEDRWHDICEANLPFLVAVDRSAKSMKPRQKRTSANQHNNNNNEPVESILGFAFADDYNDIRGMYRYTVELEVFVRNDCLRKGIGRSLMDKMVQVLDQVYDAKGGYDFPNDEAKYYPGGTRILGNIIVNVPYAANDAGSLKWKKEWLEKFEFYQAGELTDVGRKLNKKVNQVFFQRKTGNPIEANAV